MENFITVPEKTLPNGIIVPSFEVSQYCCSTDAEGKAFISATEKPRVRISYFDAVRSCEESGFKLITELQAAAIAHDIAGVDVNWTSGKVGEGALFQGLRNQALGFGVQANDFDPSDPDERRWHKLSNGQTIYDFGGHLFQWLFDSQGDERGLIAEPFGDDHVSLMAPYRSMEKGTGWRPKVGTNWSGNALVRGGCWASGSVAGVFRLGGGWPGGEGGGVGFRCTKSL